MKTDEFFYTIFKKQPHLLFDLAGIPRLDDYAFESVAVKHLEKRLDGVLRPRRGDGPTVFVEFQGYPDRAIYWRSFRQVATWYEQNPDDRSRFLLLLVFLDPSLDPGPPPTLPVPDDALVRVHLPEELRRLRRGDGEVSRTPLVVLEPLVVETLDELRRRSELWCAVLNDLKLSAEDRTFWLERLEYAVVQRFPSLTLQEIRTMLQLTPLEETVAGKQLIAIGREQGIKQGVEQGMARGELMGEIRMCQRILHLPVSSRETLMSLSMDRLRALHAELTRKL